MKKLLIACFCASLFSSCAETELIEQVPDNPHSAQRVVNDNYLLKKKFAIALHKAFTDNVQLREFIKLHALRQFDKDYDVLFNYVKDETIGTSTFRNILLHYFSNEQELIEIENTIPTLTIFVPTLPNNTFSPQSWNTSSQIPLIAIRLLDNAKTPLISSNSDSYLLDHNVIPGLPVVVLKECERIEVPSFLSYSSNKSLPYTASNGFTFKFVDFYFDNFTSLNVINNPYQWNITKLEEAWNLNGKSQNLGWQRDHMYYSINPNNPSGPFINNFQEQITSFRIDGSTGLNAMNNIADPSSVANPLNDPSLLPIVAQGSPISLGSFWTDGKFDFKVYLYHGAKTGSNVTNRSFDAAPEDLFYIEYQSILNYFYFPTNIVPLQFNKFVPLETWRLEDYSNNWTIQIEEVDLNVEHTDTNSQTVKYNANFGLDTTDDLIKKFGMKFGTSLEETQNKSWVTKYTESSDDLGIVSIHFGDNVIIGETFGPFSDGYIHRKYSSTKFVITVRPVKVQ